MKKLVLMLMLMAPLATFAQKFGTVNTQTIMQALPEIAKINGELEAQSKTYQNDLKSMQDEPQRQSDAYDKAKSTMNATAQQQKEQELQTLYQKIQQTYQDNQQALQKKQSRNSCNPCSPRYATPSTTLARPAATRSSSRMASLSTPAPTSRMSPPRCRLRSQR